MRVVETSCDEMNKIRQENKEMKETLDKPYLISKGACFSDLLEMNKCLVLFFAASNKVK